MSRAGQQELDAEIRLELGGVGFVLGVSRLLSGNILHVCLLWYMFAPLPTSTEKYNHSLFCLFEYSLVCLNRNPSVLEICFFVFFHVA